MELRMRFDGGKWDAGYVVPPRDECGEPETFVPAVTTITLSSVPDAPCPLDFDTMQAMAGKRVKVTIEIDA